MPERRSLGGLQNGERVKYVVQVTLVMPTRWAVDGLEAMTWRGLGRRAALGPMAVLLAFALVFNLIAVTRFRWEGEG
jgi:ABC-2 type transport system permease protein